MKLSRNQAIHISMKSIKSLSWFDSKPIYNKENYVQAKVFKSNEIIQVQFKFKFKCSL